jgi:nitroreductase
MLTAVEKTIRSRSSQRVFKNTKLDTPMILELIESASYAASSKNTQPWEIDLIQGQALEELRTEYLKEFESGSELQPNYTYSDEPMNSDHKARAREVGFGLFAHKKILRGEAEKMKVHYRANFEFFGAPHLIILSCRDDSEKGNFLDCGQFLGNLLTSINARGWAACPSMSAVSWPKILAKHLPHRSDSKFICGIPLGLAVEDSHTNQFRSSRRDVVEWVKVTE